MGNEGSYVALGLKISKAQIDRADKLFGSLSSEEVPARNSAWQEQASLLVGTSDSDTRCDAGAAGAGRTTSSRV
jgi:hypothetical protein